MNQAVQRISNTHRVCLAWLLSLTIVFCAGQTPVRAQDLAAAADPEWHFHFELFQMLLEQNNLQSSTNLQDILANPQQSVIVVLGDLTGIIPPRAVETFCEGGGTVLIACDSEYSAGRLAEFRAGPVHTTDAADRYQGHSDCLIITNLDEAHPLMDGVGSLVVNRSGSLGKPRWFKPVWDVIARLPQNCQPENTSTEPILVEVQISETVTAANGSIFLAADQSLFTNGMLWHGDNAILAINLSKLLCAGNKTQLCFIADGAALQSYQQSPSSNPDFQPPLPENLPDVDPMNPKLWNSIIQNVQESNLVNEVLANQPRNMSVRHYKRYVYLTLIAAASLFGLWAMFAARNGLHAAMPTRAMKSAHALTADRRIEAAEFGQAASMLARALCRELTGSEDSVVWHQKLQQGVASSSTVRGEQITPKQVAEVLDLALNTRTIHVSRRRFESLGQDIQSIRTLHQQGALQIEV
jgi:hypothetical protein